MKLRMVDMTWPEVKEAVDAGSLVVVPIGHIEEHSLHLPISTDTDITEEVAWRAAEEASKEINVVVSPTIAIGYTYKQLMKFPGTFTLRPETFINVVKEILGCLIQHGFRSIIVINGHGGNPEFIQVALRQIRDETGVAVGFIPMYSKLVAKEINEIRKSAPGGMGHACELETALQLVFKPDLVRMDKAVKEVTKPPSEILSGDWVTGSSKIGVTTWAWWEQKYGTLGDPTVATKESGEKFLNLIVKSVAEVMVKFHNEVVPKLR